MTFTSIYDTAPLRQTLTELVDPAILNDEETRVFVGATQIRTGKIEFFDSRCPGGLTFEHVVASGSLPPGFPMTEIEGKWYWDGGLFSNTPLSPAIDALEEAADGDPCAVRELIVVELFPMNALIRAPCATCCSGWFNCSTPVGSRSTRNSSPSRPGR